MKSATNRKLILLLLIGLLLAAGCSKTTPPGASSAGGSVDGVPYHFFKWDEGLAILFWHDLTYGSGSCGGSGSTEDPVYHMECQARAQDGRTLEWEITSSDGIEGQIWIEGTGYNLANGNMFIVSTQDGDMQVKQFQRDLSGLAVEEREGFIEFANQDSDVAAFILNIEEQ